MIKNILFDLDGTLLPMDLETFTGLYFKALHVRFNELGYNADLVLKGVIEGTKVMVKNDGTKSNEDAFWACFTAITNIEKKQCEADFMAFYEHDFASLGKHTTQNKNMIRAVQLLCEKGYNLLLTTNPLFPKMAVEERVRWAGIDIKAFTMMTSYEYCHYTKPNVKYYEEVIQKEHLDVSECMMVGNDVVEDGIVESLDIPLYLVKDYIINKENTPLQSKWNGTSSEFLAFVEALPNIQKN